MSQVIRHADETGQGFVTSEVPDDRPISQVIVETVASIEGTGPTELSTQLYDSVDPEALDSLYDTASDEGSLRVVFSYAGYEIEVVGENQITVREADRDPAR